MNVTTQHHTQDSAQQDLLDKAATLATRFSAISAEDSLRLTEETAQPELEVLLPGADGDVPYYFASVEDRNGFLEALQSEVTTEYRPVVEVHQQLHEAAFTQIPLLTRIRHIAEECCAMYGHGEQGRVLENTYPFDLRVDDGQDEVILYFESAEAQDLAAMMIEKEFRGALNVEHAPLDPEYRAERMQEYRQLCQHNDLATLHGLGVGQLVYLGTDIKDAYFSDDELLVLRQPGALNEYYLVPAGSEVPKVRNLPEGATLESSTLCDRLHETGSIQAVRDDSDSLIALFQKPARFARRFVSLLQDGVERLYAWRAPHAPEVNQSLKPLSEPQVMKAALGTLIEQTPHLVRSAFNTRHEAFAVSLVEESRQRTIDIQFSGKALFNSFNKSVHDLLKRKYERQDCYRHSLLKLVDELSDEQLLKNIQIEVRPLTCVEPRKKSLDRVIDEWAAKKFKQARSGLMNLGRRLFGRSKDTLNNEPL